MPANSTKLNISIYKNRDDAIDIMPGMATVKSDRITSLPPYNHINQFLDPDCYNYWAHLGDKHVGFNSIEELAELLFNNSDLINKADHNRKKEHSIFPTFLKEPSNSLVQSY